jgi:transposase
MYPSNTFLLLQELIRGVHHFEGGSLQVGHLIENFFGKIKEFKRIALLADKTDQRFAAMLYLAAAVRNSRCISTAPS